MYTRTFVYRNDARGIAAPFSGRPQLQLFAFQEQNTIFKRLECVNTLMMVIIQSLKRSRLSLSLVDRALIIYVNELVYFITLIRTKRDCKYEIITIRCIALWLKQSYVELVARDDAYIKSNKITFAVCFRYKTIWFAGGA